MNHNTPNHQNDGACCHNHGAEYGVSQSLSEMEFERGIWYAAQSNDINRVKMLLNKGLSANVEDSSGYVALHYAARNGRLEICKLLLENNADVNARTRCARATSLHRAAFQGHKEVVNLLLKFGANPDFIDDEGCSALHRAISANSVSVCRALLPITNATIENNSGLTAKQLAVKKGNPEILSLFEKY